MSNNSKPSKKLVGARVHHELDKYKFGVITKVRPDIRGYNYFVEWDTTPERNDWYSLSVLVKINHE